MSESFREKNPFSSPEDCLDYLVYASLPFVHGGIRDPMEHQFRRERSSSPDDEIHTRRSPAIPKDTKSDAKNSRHPSRGPKIRPEQLDLSAKTRILI